MTINTSVQVRLFFGNQENAETSVLFDVSKLYRLRRSLQMTHNARA